MKHHTDILAQQWPQLTLAQQLGNVGSEVSRMIRWRNKDAAIAEGAFERMLELIDLTLLSQKRGAALREITRAREVLVQTWQQPTVKDAEWDSLNKYFLNFALLHSRLSSQQPHNES